MARLACPYCARKVKVPSYVVQATILCPGCSQLFEARVEAQFSLGPPRPARPLAPDQRTPPLPQTPLLSPSHQCQHCGSPIQSAVGRPAATVVCPSCDNKTSIYAVLHLCPSCGQLLESPSRAIGTEITCSGCKNSLRVPQDVLLKERPVYGEEYRLGFSCPTCGGEVVGREEDVGSYAVCPQCRVPFAVPHVGTVRLSTHR